ncbi:MAG: hypothetical protein MUF42_16975, partial [Cytophagaceae bacterium]|nr:hypothetical protein [Cytophagaceae bacterium]
MCAQDLEALVKAKPLKISGGLGTDHVFYQADGISQRRNAPYQYFLNGNINFQLFGQLSLPVSFSYSNQKFNYTQPLNQQRFNQFGISPKYKWITAHIGWRNMTFSPYSLSGHTFAGGGVELTPGKWKIAALAGRFLKAVNYDSTETSNKPSYQRIGMGVNISYEDKGNQYGVSLFRASDDKSSLKTQLDSIGITPEDNMVLNLKAKQQLIKKLSLEGEIANSSITKDTRYVDDSKNSYLGLISENTTTVNYQAYKFGLNYQMKKAKVGMTFEHIDPGYRTHGAYFFNNDLENLTVNYARPLFKNKVQFAFNIGKQRNNLDNSKLSTMTRWVGSSTLGWQVSKKINIGFGYSNFRSYTNMRSPFTVLNSSNPYQNIDTLNFIQITQSINGNLNYAIAATKKRVQNLMLNVSTQDAADQQGGKDLNTGSTFYNGSLAY